MSELFARAPPCDLLVVAGPVAGRYRREIWQVSPAQSKGVIELAAVEVSLGGPHRVGQQG